MLFISLLYSCLSLSGLKVLSVSTYITLYFSATKEARRQHVVFPDAEYKFYLTASPEIRARRRLNDIPESNYEEILKMIIKRDEQDKKRKIAPLKIPENAFINNSDNLTVEQVIIKMKTYIKGY